MQEISIDPLKRPQGTQYSMQRKAARKGHMNKKPTLIGKWAPFDTLHRLCVDALIHSRDGLDFTRVMMCLLAGLCLLSSDIGICRAETLEPSTTPQQAWNISADRIDYDQNLDQYTATGNVRIDREGRSLTADQVQLNQRTREAFAQGNVRLVSGEDVLWGDRLELNMDNETGTLTDGTLFISKNHLYLSGKKIRKTGLETYTAEKARITSCDGPDPDWQITGRDLKVTIEGYGYAKHTALWAGDIPVLYSPFFAFPVKLKRQSGLLLPEIGTSDRKGSSYLQPLYWAINDHSDATLYAHFMSERGTRTGLEYRYVRDENTFGTVMAEGFMDRRIDDGQGNASERWGYTEDSQLRINEDRYWVRMKHDHSLKSEYDVKLDIDVVSDQDYLSEFRSGYNGFNKTQEDFQETFGREIDDFNDPVRLNRLNVHRTWNLYSFNTDLRWYDDVVKRRIEQRDDTVQQLPVISFDGIKQPLGGSSLYYDLSSSYAHLYRINGTRGHRTDLYPRIYYPTTLWQVLSVEPSAGVRQTAWYVDTYETPPDHGRDTLYRAIYDFRLDMSTELYKIYNFSLGGSDRLKHAITPEIIYEYTPDDDQSDFPEFDELDRIERSNLITYGFTNIFTSRSASLSEKALSPYTYNPFLRFKLSQSFDIDKDREGDPEPFSSVLAELDLNPGRYVALDVDAQWSIYESELDSFNGILYFWDLRGDKLSIDYRYTRLGDLEIGEQDDIESIRVAGELVVSNRWRLRGGYEYNLFDNTKIESNAGISYLSQCWGVDIDYLSEKSDEKYVMVFTLNGLGALGSRIY